MKATIVLVMTGWYNLVLVAISALAGAATTVSTSVCTEAAATMAIWASSIDGRTHR